MGLDAVEIVMAVEKDFDIQIEDSEAEQILTPGQLIDLVMSKVATTTTDICLTHRSFNLLRQFFVRRYAFPRNQLKPDTSLQTILPRTQRLAQLQELSTELAIGSFPQLIRRGWLIALLYTFSLLSGLGAAVAF